MTPGDDRPSSPPPWRPDEVAAVLRTSRKSVLELVREGTIKKVPGLGPRTIRIPDSEVRRLLAGRDDPDDDPDTEIRSPRDLVLVSGMLPSGS